MKMLWMRLIQRRNAGKGEHLGDERSKVLRGTAGEDDDLEIHGHETPTGESGDDGALWRRAGLIANKCPDSDSDSDSDSSSGWIRNPNPITLGLFHIHPTNV